MSDKKNGKPSYWELEQEVKRLREGIAALVATSPPAFPNLSPITHLAMSSTEIQSHVKELLEEPEIDPYCTGCGSQSLAYIAQYATSEIWECNECGRRFPW